MKKIKVLIVDDSAVVRAILARELAQGIMGTPELWGHHT